MLKATHMNTALESLFDALRAQIPALKKTSLSTPSLWPGHYTHGDLIFAALAKGSFHALIVVVMPSETAQRLGNRIIKAAKTEKGEKIEKTDKSEVINDAVLLAIEAVFFDALTRMNQAFSASGQELELHALAPIRGGNTILNVFGKSKTIRVDFATFWEPISVYFNFPTELKTKTESTTDVANAN